MSERLIDRVKVLLRNEVGSENITEDFVEIPTVHLETYADVSMNRKMMENRKVVVQPESIESVCKIVKIANDFAIPLIALGGATSFFVAGGAVPTEGDTIVLDTRRLNRMLALDKANDTVTVEAGMTVAHLNAVLNSHGLWFPHHPESRTSTTVGGVIATNGISPFATRYGQPGDFLLALKVVLSDGKVYGIGNRTNFENLVKLKNLFVGTEGSLGIIVEATLKVYPLPATRRKKLYGFARTFDACAAARDIATMGLYPEIVMIPSAERIYNEALLPILSRVDTAQALEGRQSFLFVVYTGDERLVEFSMRSTDQIASRFGGNRVDDSVADSYWHNLMELGAVVTPQMSATYKQRKYNSLRGGIPLESLGDFIEAEKKVFRPEGRLIDDGVTAYVLLPQLDSIAVCGVLLDDTDPMSVTEFNEWLDVVCGLYKKFGGTISAAVGVGTLLRKHVSRDLGESEALSRAIKHAIDPRELMNPGKIFPKSSGVQNETPF